MDTTVPPCCIIVLILCCVGRTSATPVPQTSCSLPCTWTEWINVDHPTNQTDSGDLETLEKIRSAGHNVCAVPQDIHCRSVRFPYIPYGEMVDAPVCKPDVGLICYNKDYEDGCLDYEVQLLCCPCDKKNGQMSDETNTKPTQAVTTVPQTSCSLPCTWTEWFNVDHPTNQTDSGDWETLEKIRSAGHNVCAVPQDIHCRSVRFPYVPYGEMVDAPVCQPDVGLICYNKDYEDGCLDYEVQLLCCPCDKKNGQMSDETNTKPTQAAQTDSPVTQSMLFNDIEIDSSGDGSGMQGLIIGNITMKPTTIIPGDTSGVTNNKDNSVITPTTILT